MNMFSTKDEVDNHVKKLLSISKNQHDNDLQCHIIAKFYYDVKEYEISKNYVKRFLKVKDNNQHALRLQAKIHENLSDFDSACKDYEKLYDLFKDENDLNKACECLSKCENINENKVKKFMSILECTYPKNTAYLKLRNISPKVTLNYSIDEIEKLKEQIKSNVNDDLKLRYLRMLCNQNELVNSVQECRQFLDCYSPLGNVELARLCFSIFHKNKLNTDDKPYFALVLIALLRNSGKVCEFDRSSYLSELWTLLSNEKLVEGIYKDILALFLYYLTSMAHCHAVKEGKLTQQLLAAISGGYLLSNSIEIGTAGPFSTQLTKWLNEQQYFARSIIGHFLLANLPLTEQLNKRTIITELLSLSKTQSDEMSQTLLEKCEAFGFRIPVIKLGDVLARDVQCLSQYFLDLKLIAWLMCSMSGFQTCYELAEPVCRFVGDIVRKLFAKLPVSPTSKRSPDNISKTDLIVFLFGTLLTYQKSLKQRLNQTETDFYPFDMWVELHVPDVIHKWWQAVCDFVLQNKRNTSIGALRDHLKYGLDSLQLTDLSMSPQVRLQLAKLTENCAIYLDNECQSLKSRSIAFYSSVLRPNSTGSMTGSFKNLPIARHRSFTSLANSTVHTTKDLFDTEQVDEATVDQWKFDAYLMIINDQLQQTCTDFDELEQMAESAEKINSTAPTVHLTKSKIYFARAQSKKTLNYGQDEVQRLVRLATDSAHEGLECVYVIGDEVDRTHMHDLLQQQLNELATCTTQPGEYSVFEFSRTIETSNSNKFLNQSALSNDFYNHSLTSNDQSIFADQIRIDQLHSEMATIGSSQEKIGFVVNSCLSQIESLKNDFNNKFEILKNQSDQQSMQHNVTVAGLSDKINKMSVKTMKLEMQIQSEKAEHCHLVKTIDQLTRTVNELTVANGLMKFKLEEFQSAYKVTSKVIHPETSQFRTTIDGDFQNIIMNISAMKHIQSMGSVMIPVNGHGDENDSDSNHDDDQDEATCSDSESGSIDEDSMEESDEESEVQEHEGTRPFVDLSKFNVNKWECSVCSCNNDDAMSKCPACGAAKPASKSTIVDLTKFKQNKWECPGCYCMNNNDLSQCPSCDHLKPGVTPPNKTAAPAQNKLQLPFTVNKTSTFTFGAPSVTESALKPAPISFGQSTETANPPPFTFGAPKSSESTSKIPISFGAPKTTEVSSKIEEIKTAAKPSFKFEAPKQSVALITPTPSQSSVVQSSQKTGFVFGVPKMSSSVPLNHQSSSYWTCKCTTANKSANTDCIACGESQMPTSGAIAINNSNDDDYDDDVIIVSEPFVTEEQKNRARALLLPDNFFYFENLPDNNDKDSSDESKPEPGFAFNFNAGGSLFGGIKSINKPKQEVKNQNEEDEDHNQDEHYDPHYEPIIELPEKVELITGEEHTECLFKQRCKLFKYINNEWKERGIGDMKILTGINKDGVKSSRLVMKRDQVHKVCCNQSIVKSVPQFSKMSHTSACWFGKDFSEGTELISEKFAIRFKVEQDLKAFIDQIKTLQDEM